MKLDPLLLGRVLGPLLDNVPEVFRVVGDDADLDLAGVAVAGGQQGENGGGRVGEQRPAGEGHLSTRMGSGEDLPTRYAKGAGREADGVTAPALPRVSPRSPPRPSAAARRG